MDQELIDDQNPNWQRRDRLPVWAQHYILDLRQALRDVSGRVQPNCSTCKHWDHDDRLSYGNCLRAASSGYAEDPDSLAVAWDADGYAAWLKTYPTFYCNQYKSKTR